MLWDTAGQEEFDAITKAYYRGAQACVLAFSTTDRNSFDALCDWKRKVLILKYCYYLFIMCLSSHFITIETFYRKNVCLN